MIQMHVNYRGVSKKLEDVAAQYGYVDILATLGSEELNKDAEETAVSVQVALDYLTASVDCAMVTEADLEGGTQMYRDEYGEVLRFLVEAEYALDFIALLQHRLDKIAQTRPDLATDLQHALYESTGAEVDYDS